MTTPQRVQLGRHGPQISFAWYEGRACLLDHDEGSSVTNAASKVCAFLVEHLPDMPGDHDIIYLATDGNWCVLKLRDGKHAGSGSAGYRIATHAEQVIAESALAEVLGVQGAA